MLLNKHSYNNQSGNVFLVILLGVALFAALSFTVSRGLQTQGTTKLSERELKLVASDIMSYTQQIGRGVDRVRGKGCSENDISFYLSNIAELAVYKHTPEVADRCKVFHTDGGGVSYRPPASQWLNTSDSSKALYGEWYFTGESCVYDVGKGGTNCFSDGIINEDLVVGLQWIHPKVCETINKELGINSGTPVPFANNRTWQSYTVFFKGSFAEGGQAIQSDQNDTSLLQGRYSGCFLGHNMPVGGYHFYNVLLAR